MTSRDDINIYNDINVSSIKTANDLYWQMQKVHTLTVQKTERKLKDRKGKKKKWHIDRYMYML